MPIVTPTGRQPLSAEALFPLVCTGCATLPDHRSGETEMAFVHPDCRAVILLRPEPIVKHDGTDNNDGERHAAQRCIPQVRQDRQSLFKRWKRMVETLRELAAAMAT